MTETSPAMQEEIINVDSRLAKVHGPFSWNVLNCVMTNEAVISNRREQMYQIVEDGQDYLPELMLIYYLMQIVEDVTSDDLPSALESLIAAEKTLADIKERAILKNVENVLQYIFIETKCHVIRKQGQLTEVVELLEEIIDVDDMNKTELAMLNGCHCSALSLYVTSTEEGIKYANKAIEYEPDNGKWHLWLARFYREKRRNKLSCQKFEYPDTEEASAFAKAYQLSPSEYTGVALAQLYRESNDTDKAEEMYKEIHAFEPTSWKIRLQLALGFIRTNNCILAKECLDYVTEEMPGSPTYMHYMAIFEEKCNHDYKAALQYYERTTEQLNNAAEEQYMKCKKKVEPEWDPLPYLLDLPERYKGFASHVTQPMYIQIGLYYLQEKHNVIAACQYLAEAIKMNPDNKQLRNQLPLFRRVGRVNMYHILANEVEAALRNAATRYNEEEIGILKHTLELCHANCNYIPPSAELSRAQTKGGKTYKAPKTGLSSCMKNNSLTDEEEDMLLLDVDDAVFNETVCLSTRLRKRVDLSQPSSHASSAFRDKRSSVTTDRVGRRCNQRADNDDKCEAKSRRLAKTMKHLNL